MTKNYQRTKNGKLISLAFQQRRKYNLIIRFFDATSYIHISVCRSDVSFHKQKLNEGKCYFSQHSTAFVILTCVSSVSSWVDKKLFSLTIKCFSLAFQPSPFIKRTTKGWRKTFFVFWYASLHVQKLGWRLSFWRNVETKKF